MPIYQYKCLSCGLEFELLCKMADMDAIETCPSCSNKSIRRIFPTSLARSLNQEDTNDKSEKRVPNLTLNNVLMKNCGTGIKADDVPYIKGKHVTMKDCGVGIDAKNSDIDIGDLDIS